MSTEIILMGDVIGSRDKNQENLHQSLNSCIDEVNKVLKEDIISPLTITLGDEFQGFISRASIALKIIFFIDEYTRNQDLDYELRFSVHKGRILTTLNPEHAHNMLGEGLTYTRELLNSMSRRERQRFRIKLSNQTIDHCLEQILNVYDGIIQSWNLNKDKETLKVLIDVSNDQEAGKLLGKTRQQIWKRRNNLFIREYSKCKDTILTLGTLHYD